jgi:hypothetical protein
MGVCAHWNLKYPTISKTFKCAFQIYINIPQCTLRGISVSFFRNSSSSSFFRAVRGAKKGRTAVPRASGLVLMFCGPELISGSVEGAGSRFHVLCSQTHFWRYEGAESSFHVLRSRTRFGRYRGRCDPFSYFALPDSFSAVPRALGPVFMICALRLVLVGTDGVGSRFHVLRSQTYFRRYRKYIRIVFHFLCAK